MSEPVELKVSLGYSVWVGRGLLERARELIPLPEAAERIALVTDADVRALHGVRAIQGLRPAGIPIEEFTTPPGEASKTMAAAEALARGLAASGFHRADALVTLGGGVVGDLGGFVAATYHRGIAFAQMPTTLLAQVDASIGGKTGVNLPEGKNLVGSFHQPSAVIADVATLATVPAPEFVSGLAEVLKHGLVADPGLIEDVSRHAGELVAREPGAMARVVARAAAVKVRVVERDETDRGARAFLNYGHTLGHALETLGQAGKAPRRRHGEAVAIGMVFAAALARGIGYADTLAEHRRCIEAVGLPTRGAAAPMDAVLSTMRADKKYRGGLRFVVLEEIARPRLVEGVDDASIRAAYREVE